MWQQRFRGSFLLLVLVLLLGIMLWIAIAPRQATFSQGQEDSDDAPVAVSDSQDPECAVFFTGTPGRLEPGAVGVFSFGSQSADPGSLSISPPDIEVARVVAVAEDSVSLRANADGWGDLTVSMLCENSQQAGQRVGATTRVVVGNATAPAGGETSGGDPDGATGKAEENAPDLEVLYPSVNPTRVRVGDRVTIRVEVHNEGDQPAPATSLTFYRSSNSTISRLDTGLGSRSVGILLQEAHVARSLSVNAPNASGTYWSARA